MRYLCLIHLDRERFGALPEASVEELNVRHLELNEELLRAGHFIEAEALQGPGNGVTVRPRNGRPGIVDGPFVETKEILGGFYLIEARDLNEAIQIASRFPGAAYGRVDVLPCRDLVVDGVPRQASSKPRGPGPTLTT